MNKKILIASNNAGKVREIREILADFYEEFLTPRDLNQEFSVVEDGQTFEDNAILKAEAACKQFGMDALADDSGLCVDALNGAPGVYSARFTPEGTDAANNQKLLKLLENIPDEQRTAKFVSAVALARAGRETVVVRGEAYGRILRKEVGKNGFGYDPLFYDEKFCRTYAELNAEEKNAISHRSAALHRLYERLVQE